MLIAHVERDGVWLIERGMHQLALALAKLATERGASFRYETTVSEIVVSNGRATGVKLASGEHIEADAVVSNTDVAALANGHLGAEVMQAVPRTAPSARSLSAVTWNLVAETSGFPLVRHTVFFSDNYAAEFDDIFRHGRLPTTPTVYVCAQDRDDHNDSERTEPERLLCLVNAPPIGDTHDFSPAEIAQCEARAFGLLERCGLHVARRPEASVVTTPTEFNRLFPATGGALYGQASHGWQASFSRPGSRSKKIEGLYFAGGSVHPGAGVPMAALSGRLAAASVIEDF
jgi:1-hydroxycarotenoid 3,4-desaturase